MNPNIAANQQRLFLEFFAELRPHLRRDSALPRRIKVTIARHRSIGSRDRKLYRELIYTAVRFLPWIDGLLDSDAQTAAKIIAWLLPTLPTTEAYQKTICGEWVLAPEDADLKTRAVTLHAYLGQIIPPGRPPQGGARSPDALSADRREAGFHPCHPFDPQALLPAWFREHCPAAFTDTQLDAINSRASIWVRIQCTDRNLVLDEFRAKNWAFDQPTDFPDAICLPPNAEVANTDAYRRGFVEIQDLGSQLVLAHADIAPGGRWLDACAGAGGKTLQLARLLGPQGHVDATDIRPVILDELRDRAQRARLDNISIVRGPANVYDGALVDAPCSGSGTWRRQPHLKWCMQPEALVTFVRMQLEILTTNAPHVRAGGLLIYVTCSLSHYENRDVIAAFLKPHPQFTPEAPVRNYGGEYDGLGTSLLPGARNTDGFYVALLRRQS
ncbi:MAG: RsmB/NOP family class I SAM-dependent RNA methyltransferase [Lacunisphaera sp.]|nr:RsmB/NOP family class I SAM-dependent RNA methyltransferase [Lacunisphaera sp.]